MNFASWTFVLVFLPATTILFLLLRGEASGQARRILLICASIAFYAWSGLANAGVLALSMAVNFAAGSLLTREDPFPRSTRKAILWTAVFANVGMLAGFKVAALASAEPNGFRVAESILIPLALSFVTFQQIGFITACYRGTVKRFAVSEYLFFVAFFPQLVLGPIVRFQDMVGQLRAGRLGGATLDDLAVGLSIFIFGFAQKVLLADQIAPSVDAIFDAANRAPVSVGESWFAITAFQLQLYFDFAGYADMAIGLARMFGINLPINFDRPLFAFDRFDLWRRWHITFAVFMRNHVFLPLVRHAHFSLPAALAVTGILSGLWHGLGWTFILWGLIQTVILLVVHERRRRWRNTDPPSGLRKLRMIALTFLTSALIGGLFRSSTLEGAANIYGSLVNFSGATFGSMLLGPRAMVMLPLCVIAAWGLPNGAQFFHRYWTAIDPRAGGTPPPPQRPNFSLSARWAVAIGVTLALCLILSGESRRFVYVQF